MHEVQSLSASWVINCKKVLKNVEEIPKKITEERRGEAKINRLENPQ